MNNAEIHELAVEHIKKWFSPEGVPAMLADHDAMATLERNIAKELRSPLYKGVVRPVLKLAIPEELRWEVFERDDFRCQAPGCGSRRMLRADHIVPESRGGATTLDNLQTLCRSCNSKKGTRQPAPTLTAH